MPNNELNRKASFHYQVSKINYSNIYIKYSPAYLDGIVESQKGS